MDSGPVVLLSGQRKDKLMIANNHVPKPNQLGLAPRSGVDTGGAGEDEGGNIPGNSA